MDKISMPVFFQGLQLFKDHAVVDKEQKTTAKNVVSVFMDGRVTFYRWSFVCFSEFRLWGGNNVTDRVNNFVTQFKQFRADSIGIPLHDDEFISRLSWQLLRWYGVGGSRRLSDVG